MTITVEDTEPVCSAYGVRQKQFPNSIMGTLFQNFDDLSSVELHFVFQKMYICDIFAANVLTEFAVYPDKR